MHASLCIQLFLLGVVGALRYNNIRQKSAHNTYAAKEQYPDVLIHHHVRSVEIDIHKASEAGKWDIYHMVKGDGTSVNQLSDAVKVLTQFHNLNPSHEVVTVFVDMKDGVDSSHSAADFDAVISAHLPLWTPADARGNYANISAGIVNNGWPTTDALQGKFIFVITDHQDCPSGCYVSSEADANGRKAFAAFSDISTLAHSPYKVFYNMKFEHRELGKSVHKEGFVSRIYKSDDVKSASDWSALVAAEINHLATDQINYHEDTWSRTHNSLGYPFEAIDGTDTAHLSEGLSTISAFVASGDIDGKNDHFAFRYHDEGKSEQTVEWTLQVSASNSHVQEWAKGCFMVREHVDGGANNMENSAYFAICRPADDHFIRIQYRKEAGDDTVHTEGSSDVDGIDDQGRIMMKLQMSYSAAGGSVCTGFFSTDAGSSWVKIGQSITFAKKNLQFHGLAASSHDHTGTNQDNVCTKGHPCVKHDFMNVKRSGKSQPLEYFSKSVLVGNGVFEAHWKDGY